MNALRWLGFSVLLALPGSDLDAQSANPFPGSVQPERPTVATHAGTVATGWFEIESGVEYDRFRDRTHAVGVPSVFKFGVGRRAQLSLMVPLAAPPGGSIGPGDFGAGLKLRLLEHAGPLGDFAIFPSFKLATGSEAAGRGTGTTDLSLLLISSHMLGPVAMDLNAGITRRSGDGTTTPKTATVWTASFGGTAAGSLGWVAEVFGYPGTHGPAGNEGSVALLAGPTVRIRPWLSLDAGGILPLTGPQPKALYAGLVWNAGRYWPGGLRRSPPLGAPSIRGDRSRSGK